jgi:hypothetical protein
MASPQHQAALKASDWSRHVPVVRRRQAVLQRALHHGWTRISSRRARLIYLVASYLAITIAVLISTSISIAFLALAPLLLLPILGFLAYWLVWSDYHR